MIYLTLAVASLLSSLLEGITYSGYIFRHVHIHSYVVYLFSFLATALLPRPKVKSKFIYILPFIVTVIFFFLIFMESINFPNYMYTHFHINPVTFQFFLGVLWFHSFIIRGTSILKTLIITSLIFIGIEGAGRTTGLIYSKLLQIIKSPFASYESKMAAAYPGFYPAMQHVKKLTPEDANIYIPPQGNPWEIEGNMAMVEYFLYPRKVKNLDPNTINNLPPKSYLLIAKGSWEKTGETDYGWPKIKVPAKSLWFIDLKSNQSIQEVRDYNPDTDKWDWGLIEVYYE